jgi:hypothetical protein
MLGYGQAAFRKGLMAARTGNGRWSPEYAAVPCLAAVYGVAEIVPYFVP